jgi:hypothetical protein
MTSKPRRITERFPFLLPLLGLALSLAGVATWWLVPPLSFTAHTQLRVSRDPQNPLFPEKSSVDNDAFLQDQAFLNRDRFVLSDALRRRPELSQSSLLKDRPDPLQWLEQEIKVDFPRPEYIHISLSGDQPDELTQLVTAVTESYLENVVDREGKTRHEELTKLKQIHDEFLKRTKNKRQRIRDLSRNVGPIDERNLVIQQQIDLENLREVKKELVQVHSELRDLRIELGLHPDWVEQIWPQYVAILNYMPGPGFPINHAVVALLHDEAHLLHQADEEKRRQMSERLRFLEAKQKALYREADDLDKKLQQNRRDAADLVEEKVELAREEEVWQKAHERILKMELEQDVPARLVPIGDKGEDSRPKVKAILYTTNESNRKWMTRGAMTLAGLGMLLLVLQAIRYRAQGAHEILGDSPTIPLPE